MSMKGKGGTPSIASSSKFGAQNNIQPSVARGTFNNQSIVSSLADPRNTSPIEAAMSMRMSMMTNNTNVASSRRDRQDLQDQSAVSNSMKL